MLQGVRVWPGRTAGAQSQACAADVCGGGATGGGEALRAGRCGKRGRRSMDEIDSALTWQV